ncbi:DUF397 domain-containing protein [Streptomyces sp. 6N223]|uniref:DUF397 domain-containing protein n=1 Tax=Streptomyces sp. 6N223 TaxID=3457412 RepID=UPI003FD2BC0B
MTATPHAHQRLWQKSSYSGDSSNCLEVSWQKMSYNAEASSSVELRWQQSSHCQEGSACLNIAVAADRTALLRESDDPATVIATTPARLAGLLAAVKAGRL